MSESKDSDDTYIHESVRLSLDYILDRVIAESNRVSNLRSLAQRVLDELVTNATSRRPSCDGDVDIVRGRGRDVLLGHDQHTQQFEGQTNNNDANHDMFENREHATSACKRSRSLSALPTDNITNTQVFSEVKSSSSYNSLSVNTTWFSSHNIHTRSNDVGVSTNSLLSCYSNGVVSSPSCISVSANTWEISQKIPPRQDSISESANSLLSGLSSDVISSTSNCSEVASLVEVKEYPVYEMVKIVKTKLGVIKIHCNGDLDGAELNRIITESERILYTNKMRDADVKSTTGNKKGMFARMRKFFRRLCCCVADKGDE